MKILIIKLGALGDVVRTSYFLRGLSRKAGSQKHITWITSRPAVPLLRHHPEVDELLTFEDINEQRVPWARRHFDWVISLDDETKACSLLREVTWKQLTGAFLEDGRVSYSADASPWFDMGLVSRFGKAEADALKKVNRRTHDEIFADILGIEVEGPELYHHPAAAEEALRLLHGRTGHYLGLNLSAGTRWLNKRLNPAEAERLVRLLLDGGFSPLLVGGPEDLAYNETLARQTDCPLLSPVPLDTFAAVIGRLKAIIVADTLALHLAIAQRVPSVSFYAPTSAAEINSFCNGLKVASTAPDYCNYRSDADNSTITADRLFEAWVQLNNEKLSVNRREPSWALNR